MTRVELHSEKFGESDYNQDIHDKILIEEYDKDFRMLSSRFIAKPLPRWGHFFAGEKYNFIITGQNNPGKSDDVEVLRVSKYSKDWAHIDDCHVRGINTKDVFDFCTMRSTEANGALFLRTGHGIYNDHQSNLTLQVNEETMELIACNDGGDGSGYVSHSFNQFILVDEDDNLVAVDHGDAYPRGIVLFKYPNKASLSPYYTAWQNIPSTMIKEFPGSIGDNYTSCMVGGLEETRNGYLVSYSHKEGSDPGTFLAFVDKDTLTAKTVKVSGIEKYTAPIIAPISLDGGYIMWRPADDNYPGRESDPAFTVSIKYAAYDADGNIGEIKTGYGRLSDCKPIMWNGKLLWYVVDGEGAGQSLHFYTLDENGIESHVPSAPGYTPPDAKFPKSDENFVFEEDVLVEYRGNSRTVVIPKGTRVIANSAFEKNHDIDTIVIPSDTYADEVTGENYYHIGYNVFTPFKKPVKLYVSMYFNWGLAFSIYDNYEMVDLNIGEPPSLPKPPEPTVGGFSDVKQSAYYADSVLWAVENGITSGIGGGRFAPGGTCNREQIVTFLYRSKGSPAVDITDSFSDMPKLEEFRKAISWAVEDNITSGIGGGKFAPGKGCTRAEAMTFIWRAAGRPEPKAIADFADMPSNSDFKKAISWAVENNITKGIGNNRFGPGETCKREHIVTFLYNAKDL